MESSPECGSWSKRILRSRTPRGRSRHGNHVCDLQNNYGKTRLNIHIHSNQRPGEKTSLLDAAARCLDVADKLLEAQGHHELAMDYLEQCLTNAEEADRLIVQAELAELQQVLATGEAESIAWDAGVDWPADVARTLGRSEELTSRAVGALGDDRSRAARMLRARAEELKSRALLLKRALE